MLTWFKNLLKDLWNPEWRFHEEQRRRFEKLFAESDARLKEMDEERDRQLRERDAANLSDQPRRRGK